MREQTERLLWWLVTAIAIGGLAIMCARNLRADELDQLSDRQVQLHAENQRHRVAAGLAPQQLDAELCRLCQAHAERQAAAGWGAAQSDRGVWFWAAAFRGGSGGGSYTPVTPRRWRLFRR